MRIFFAILFACAVLAMLGMLYWSSTLIEKDVKGLRLQLGELKTELQSVRFSTSTQALSHEARRPKADSSPYPNLLKEDRYFTETLPKELPSHFVPHGIRKEALLGRPEHLHPFNPFRSVTTLLNMCSLSVAEMEFGKYETLSPAAAYRMEARPIPDKPTAEEYWVFLRDDLFWQPLKASYFPDEVKLSPHFLKRHPVTAYDFKFFYDAVMNPNISEAKAVTLRTYFDDIDEFRVIDEKTFVVRWKTQLVDNDLGEKVPKVKYTARGLTGSLQPLASFVYQYFSDGKKILDDDDDPSTYRLNSVWAQNFAEHWAKNIIVSCGPWVFEGMTDEGIALRRNPDYFNPYAVLVDELHYSFRESFDAIWQDFKAGKIDLCTLAPSQLPEYDQFLHSELYRHQEKQGLGVQLLEYVDHAYYYIGWNHATPYFRDEEVRRAMTMAIDRNRIIEQNLNDMGVPITGPFFRYSPSYDPTIEAWPYDPDEARRLLDAAGWIDLDGDGIREKIVGGKRIPFRFTMVYYAKNLSTRIICEYIATTLREVGVECLLNGLDITDLARVMDDKSFDAVYMGWALGTPPEDPRQLWHSSGAAEKGSSNTVGFADKQADEIIFDLNYTYNLAERRKLYHAFHRIIHEKTPYTFLYSPKSRLLYRNYVQNLFIPRARQDLVPGADITEPDLRVIWLDQ